MHIITADLIKFETKILLISKFMAGIILSLCLIFHRKSCWISYGYKRYTYKKCNYL